MRLGNTKQQLSNGKSFVGEMKDHGLSTDLQEIQRFNYVLASRSIDLDNNENTQSTNHESSITQQLKAKPPTKAKP